MRSSLSPLSTTVVAVAFALAACGEAVPGQERLAGAADRTQQQGTAHITVESRMEQTDESGGPMDLTFTGEGQVDFAAERMHLAMQVPGMPDDQRTEAIHDADVLYVRPPFPDPELRWIRHDLGAQDSAAGASMGMGGLGGPMADLTVILDAATGSVGEVEELGPEEVREVATTGYGFRVSLLDLLDLDGDSPGAEHLEDLEVDVATWLDREDRVRRLRLTFDLASMHEGTEAWTRAQHEETGEQPPPDSASATPDGTFTTTLEWFDFGEPVDITVPDEDDLIDEDTLMEEIRRSDSASVEAEISEDVVVPDDVVIDEDGDHHRETFGDVEIEVETRQQAPGEPEPSD